MNSLDIVNQLERTRDETLRRFDLGADALQRDYGPGKWTVRVILQHLADAECVYGYRIKCVISEPRQVVWATDQDAWSRRLDYAGARLDIAKHLFDAARVANIELAMRYYPGSDAVFCVHSLEGRNSLQDLFDRIVSHNRNHLSQIDLALRSPTAA